MSDFNQAIEVILKHEIRAYGTPKQVFWSNNKKDRGGETAWGISMLIIRREGLTLQDLGIDNWKPGCLKKMPLSNAIALYKRLFWDKYKYDKITEQIVATKIFDAAVNMGPGRAHRLAQQAAIDCGQKLIVDGILGPNSTKAINSCSRAEWLVAMAQQMQDRYLKIVEDEPDQSVFLKGWLKRAEWVG